MNSKLLISTHLNLISSSSCNSSVRSTTLQPGCKLFTHTVTLKSTVRASCNCDSDPPSSPPKTNQFSLKTTAAAVIFAAAAFGGFPCSQLKAEVLSPSASVIDYLDEEVSQKEETIEKLDDSSNSPLTRFLESNPKAVEELKTLLQQKLEAGEDAEGLKLLRQLSSAQPENNEWKFLMAKVLNEMENIDEARDVFEEILVKTPLSFEALFENALLMDRSGEGEAVIRRLESALRVAEAENLPKEARDVKLIIAQMHFLQKNLDTALKLYEELMKEDPNDFRPYFCKGVIFSLMDRNTEAREEFAKYRELSPKKFEVEGYLRTSLSRMKLFGTEEEN